MCSTFPFINTLSEGGFRVTKNTNLLIFKTSKSSRLQSLQVKANYKGS